MYASLHTHRVRVTRLVAGKETVAEASSGETLLIAAHVPHLFEFVEDTLMTVCALCVPSG